MEEVKEKIIFCFLMKMAAGEQPELPLEMYHKIMKYVPLQSAFRKTSSSIKNLPVKHQYYCQEPTLAELVDWIWEQHILLSFEQTFDRSILTGKDFSGNTTKDVFLEFIEEKTPQNGKQVFISLKTGLITLGRSDYNYFTETWDVTGYDIKRKSQLLEELRGFRLAFENFSIVANINWPTSRDILSKRLDPKIQNNFYLSDICYINLISQKFPIALKDDDWDVIINEMHNVLSLDAASSMSSEFIDKFFNNIGQTIDTTNIGPIQGVQFIKIPPHVFNTWLKSFISTLTPLDLSDDVRLKRIV